MEAALFLLNVALVVYLCSLVVKMDKPKDKNKKKDKNQDNTKPLHIFSYKETKDTP